MHDSTMTSKYHVPNGSILSLFGSLLVGLAQLQLALIIYAINWSVYYMLSNYIGLIA